MQHKRGVSPLISWVLLIGFVVTLSVIVTTWVKQQAEERTAALVTEVEGDLRCNQVAFNANLDCSVTPEQITIANTGKYTILRVKVRQPGNTEDIDLSTGLTQGLEPTKQTTKGLKGFETQYPADIIPIIALEGKETLCSARKIVVAC